MRIESSNASSEGVSVPKRTKGEPLGEFIGKFVKSKREKAKFPELSQRLAVGYSEAKRKAKK